MVVIRMIMDTIMAKRRTVTTMILATHMITTNTTMTWSIIRKRNMGMHTLPMLLTTITRRTTRTRTSTSRIPMCGPVPPW